MKALPTAEFDTDFRANLDVSIGLRKRGAREEQEGSKRGVREE